MDINDLRESFAESASFRDIEVFEETENRPALIIKIRGVVLSDVITNKKVWGSLLADLQNADFSGEEIIDRTKINFSEDAYNIINMCIVDEDQKLLFTPAVIKTTFPSTLINEMILDIADLTIPTKKKLIIQQKTANRIKEKLEIMKKRQNIK